MRHERSIGSEAMGLHRVDPPIDFATHAFLSARLRRTVRASVSFNANNVVVVKRIERFVPRLLANQFHYFLRHFFRFHFPPSLDRQLLVEKFLQTINHAVPAFVVAIAGFFTWQFLVNQTSSVPPSRSDSSTVTTLLVFF